MRVGMVGFTLRSGADWGLAEGDVAYPCWAAAAADCDELPAAAASTAAAAVVRLGCCSKVLLAVCMGDVAKLRSEAGGKVQ